MIRSEAAAAAGDIDAALKIASGDTPDGLALMEESSMSAISGELSPFATGVTACRMISACRDLTDYRRASEGIEATEKHCQRQSLSGFPGVCRIHRAEVIAVSGAWERAEQELERATSELEDYKAVPPQADGYYAIGDIRRLKGDFEGAEAGLREAHARGRSPQPALALIRLAEGKTRAAASAINAAVADQTWDRWARSRLLASGGEEIVNSTGDGFFVAFDSARGGVDCAISIQRALRDHRDSTGFAISVRIGIHTAEANRRGTDYSGMGVHVAARVAALAGGGEILVTAESLAEAGEVAVSATREEPVKGVSTPVSVALVAWA